MESSLKVGVAGLGRVGTPWVAQLARQQAALIARCGCAIEVVAVTARSRGKDRGIDLKKVKWFSDPVALAKSAEIDVFVELIGGAGAPAKAIVEGGVASGKGGVPGKKALFRNH